MPGADGEGARLHEFPSGRPASSLCPMRSVRGGTRLTFPHHFTVTFGRQAGSHARALSPEFVNLFGISLLPRSSSLLPVCARTVAPTQRSRTLGCGHSGPGAPARRLRTKPRSSERHERDPEAPAQRAGNALGSRPRAPPAICEPRGLKFAGAEPRKSKWSPYAPSFYSTPRGPRRDLFF